MSLQLPPPLPPFSSLEHTFILYISSYPAPFIDDHNVGTLEKEEFREILCSLGKNQLTAAQVRARRRSSAYVIMLGEFHTFTV